ncbi:hypothetical protein [Streptomyces luteireticuli]|uniref:Uncharacterized protein n=1 Tax=Streptomyces luteireticuli TaxID=173858 RepID=A0ABN0YZ01_9ACTN
MPAERRRRIRDTRLDQGEDGHLIPDAQGGKRGGQVRSAPPSSTGAPGSSIPGGPGGAGLDYAATKRAKLPERVRRAYDLVGFDPRGVGRSAPVGCGATGGFFRSPAPAPAPAPPNAPWPTGAGAALPQLSTEATAHAMDDLRVALGEERLGFLGVFASRGNTHVDDTVVAYPVDGKVPGVDARCTGGGCGQLEHVRREDLRIAPDPSQLLRRHNRSTEQPITKARHRQPNLTKPS